MKSRSLRQNLFSSEVFMDIPFIRWYEAIAKRRSYRTYDKSKVLEPEKIEALNSVCKEFKPFPGVRATPVTEPREDVFKFIAGSYGVISDAPAFIAFIGDTEHPNVNEYAGYIGEGIILEATALGLGSCWVAAAFSAGKTADIIEMNDNERLMAVTPLGYAVQNTSIKDKVMTGFGRTHKRLSVEKLVTGLSYEQSPEWIKDAIEAARLAPSAVNRQPWGFNIEEDGITVFVRSGGTDFNISYRLDCGIAMLHIEVAALNAGIGGKWEFLESPGVARFRVV
jgi:nitroreductase